VQSVDTCAPTTVPIYSTYSRNFLDGTFPSAIFELPDLQKLELKSNKIFMKFDNIEKAKKLELLYLSSIDIGSIKGIGKAPALREL